MKSLSRLTLTVLAGILPALGQAQIRAIAPVTAPILPHVLIAPSLGLNPASSLDSAPLLEVAPLRLAFEGPPGSGKSTHGKRLAAESGLTHIITSDLLREYAKTDPSVLEKMKRGELVDPELVIALVKERLSRKDVQRGFIIDGFPRKLAEAQALEKMGPEIGIDAVIFLDVPDAELFKRVAARGRVDDDEAVFKNRLEAYRRETLPAIEHLARRVPLLSPDAASADIDTNYAHVRSALEEFLRNRNSPKS